MKHISDTPILRVEHLTIVGASAAMPLLSDVGFVLRPGEVMGLIGESGAGKSTLGLACLGYVRPGCTVTGGKVVFDGRDLFASRSFPLTLRGTQITYVAQSAAASFNPAHTLLDQCSECLVVNCGIDRRQAAAKVIELFAIVGLSTSHEFAERYPHEVSGGQLQRAMIVMAMVTQPSLIVFDEPTTALDVTTQVEVLMAIKSAIALTKAAAVYISHDLAVVAQVADHAMILRHGRMVEQQPIRSMLTLPRMPYTKDLISVRHASRPRRSCGPGDSAALSVNGLSVAYGDKRALEKISFSVARGRTLAVVGESGSGKSTLARVVSGQLAPVEGELVWKGERLPVLAAARSRETLRQIQLIHQSPDMALNPRHRVREILGRPPQRFFGLAGDRLQQRVRQLLAMVDLEPERFILRYPRELSGGQKQRICIARALAAEPELLICDEITASLDQLVAKEILGLVRDLQEARSFACIFISHDIEVVRSVADDILVLQNGAAIECGQRDAVLERPSQDYTKRLLAAVPTMDPDWLEGFRQRQLEAQALKAE